MLQADDPGPDGGPARRDGATAQMIGEEVAARRRHGRGDADRAARCSRHKDMNNKSIAEIIGMVERDQRHWRVYRAYRALRPPAADPARPEAQHGDILTFYGTPDDTARAVKTAACGYELWCRARRRTSSTSARRRARWSLLIGLLVWRVGSIPLTPGFRRRRCRPAWYSAGRGRSIRMAPCRQRPASCSRTSGWRPSWPSSASTQGCRR
ncbi:hypothetical protein ACU4GD_45515 [Cupriavidus basilensis]